MNWEDRYKLKTSSSSEDICGRRKKKTRKNKNENKTIQKLLSRIDNRRSPEIEKFDPNSGETLREYLARFERYCRDNLKGDSTYWLVELEKHLSGKSLKALQSLKSKRDTYKTLKKKLVSWDLFDTKDLQKKKSRDNFASIKYVPKEELYLFVCRLETQYKLAYPKHDSEKSSSLRERIIDTSPRYFRKALTNLVQNYEMEGRKPTLKSIKKLAEQD